MLIRSRGKKRKMVTHRQFQLPIADLLVSDELYFPPIKYDRLLACRGLPHIVAQDRTTGC